MRGWAFGLLHLSRRDFYEMRPGEFWEALAAHTEEVNANRRHIGELARGATLRLLNIQLASKDRIKDVSKFWPMPWDNPTGKSDADEVHRLVHLDEAGQKEEVDKFFSRLKNNGKQ